MTTTVNVNVSAAGNNGEVQFNNSGAFGADSAFYWDNANKRLGIGTGTPSTTLDIQGNVDSDSGILSAELLTNLGWTTTGWAGDFTLGFTHTTGNTNVLSNTFAAVTGTYYQITYTITGRTSGSVTIAFGGLSIASVTSTGAFGPRATTTGNLTITPTSDFNGTIVISVKSISTSNATITFKNSNGTVVNEIRNHSVITNTLMGRSAGERLTTGNSSSFFGANSGANTTTGERNCFFGERSGFANTTGVDNCFFGERSGFASVNATNNAFFGATSGLANTSGGSNSFFGAQSGNANTTGASNTFMGRASGFSNNTGTGNTFVGREAAFANTTGSNNVAFGLTAGRFVSGGGNLTISNNSIFIGVDTRSNADNETNQIVIGYQAIGTGSNSVTLGNTSITRTNLRGQIVISGFAAAPTGIEGAIYYDTVLKKHYGFDGTTWNALY